jgi:hypothetical protein
MKLGNDFDKKAILNPIKANGKTDIEKSANSIGGCQTPKKSNRLGKIMAIIVPNNNAPSNRFLNRVDH